MISRPAECRNGFKEPSTPLHCGPIMLWFASYVWYYIMTLSRPLNSSSKFSALLFLLVVYSISRGFHIIGHILHDPLQANVPQLARPHKWILIGSGVILPVTSNLVLALLYRLNAVGRRLQIPHTEIAPFDRFSCFIAQKTCFGDSYVHFWVRTKHFNNFHGILDFSTNTDQQQIYIYIFK